MPFTVVFKSTSEASMKVKLLSVYMRLLTW